MSISTPSVYGRRTKSVSTTPRESLYELFVKHVVQELQVIHAVLEGIFYKVLDKLLCKVQSYPLIS